MFEYFRSIRLFFEVFDTIRSLFDRNSIIFCLLLHVFDLKIDFEYFGHFWDFGHFWVLCVFGLLLNFSMFGVLEILIDIGI